MENDFYQEIPFSGLTEGSYWDIGAWLIIRSFKFSHSFDIRLIGSKRECIFQTHRQNRIRTSQAVWISRVEASKHESKTVDGPSNQAIHIKRYAIDASVDKQFDRRKNSNFKPHKRERKRRKVPVCKAVTHTQTSARSDLDPASSGGRKGRRARTEAATATWILYWRSTWPSNDDPEDLLEQFAVLRPHSSRKVLAHVAPTASLTMLEGMCA